MRYVSLFDGIGAAHLAARGLGWECVAVAEIDPQASAVVEHRFPGLRNMGDVATADWSSIGPVDLVCGGAPCQSFSVAGKRLGLDDPRGNLSLEFVRVARQLRAKWLVYENVPGLLSMDKGRAFATFLGLLADNGYHVAWRVLDAQFAGVPQRRRRVFLVGHLGDWRPPAAVLFERESLSGHPPPRRETGQGIASSLTRGADSSGRGGYAGRRREDDESLVIPALTSSGRGYPAVAFDLRGRDGGAMPEGEHDTANIRASTGGSSRSYVAAPMMVRRLTPREWERLQGFPDDFTLVPWRGKPMADGPRYRMLGNSWAVPVARWIFERIDLFQRVTAQARAA